MSAAEPPGLSARELAAIDRGTARLLAEHVPSRPALVPPEPDRWRDLERVARDLVADIRAGIPTEAEDAPFLLSEPAPGWRGVWDHDHPETAPMLAALRGIVGEEAAARLDAHAAATDPGWQVVFHGTAAARRHELLERGLIPRPDLPGSYTTTSWPIAAIYAMGNGWAEGRRGVIVVCRMPVERIAARTVMDDAVIARGGVPPEGLLDFVEFDVPDIVEGRDPHELLAGTAFDGAEGRLLTRLRGTAPAGPMECAAPFEPAVGDAELELFAPATVSIWELARRQGALNALTPLHSFPYVATVYAVGAAKAEAIGEDPFRRIDATFDVNYLRRLYAAVAVAPVAAGTPLVLTVRVPEAMLLPVAAAWRCRFPRVAVPIAHVREVRDVTAFVDSAGRAP
jgi:hypothetical protein